MQLGERRHATRGTPISIPVQYSQSSIQAETTMTMPGDASLTTCSRTLLARISGPSAQRDANVSGLDAARYGQNDPVIALGRKNHLFAGSDGGGDRWATVCS